MMNSAYTKILTCFTTSCDLKIRGEGAENEWRSEDGLDAEDGRLRHTPTMMVAPAPPLLDPDLSDPPHVLVADVTIHFALGVAPNPGSFARGYRRSRQMLIERVIVFTLIVSDVGLTYSISQGRSLRIPRCLSAAVYSLQLRIRQLSLYIIANKELAALFRPRLFTQVRVIQPNRILCTRLLNT
jgi:hypothetical protein